MKIKKIKNSNDGVAGIVVSLLMIGLVISAISFVQSVFVPQWMSERESEHMEEVAKQFSQLKFAVDNLILSENSISSINCPITLGSKEMPFLFSTRSYGDLEILSDDYKIDIDYFINSCQDRDDYSFNLNSISYTSHNAYYINQNYIFENGAVILNQDGGNITKLYPNIDLKEDVSVPTIVMNSVNFIEFSGKTVASGYGTYPIQAQYSTKDYFEFYNVENITIYNSHLDAWEEVIKSTFSKSDSLSYEIRYITSPDNDEEKGLKICFDDGSYYPTIKMYIHSINVKFSPGWIK